MPKHIVVVLATAGLVGCSGAKDLDTTTQAAAVCSTPTAGAPQLGTTFNVRFGQQATIASEGLTLKFDQVIGDSRCPEDVICIWMGEATIVVRATHPPQAAEDVQLKTPGPSPDNTATYDGYEIELVRIVPHTNSTQPIDPADYCAELRVERVP